MEKKAYEAILNKWQINNEAERWSLKKKFMLEYEKHDTSENFIKFLKQTLNRDEKATH